jgi:ABC-type antimicrobial peptide transport system permease subunit
VYGVIARTVAARTREIGLRMAVGADRRAIAGGVLREGLTLAGMGCGLGLIAGVAASSVMRTLLFGVSPLDAWTYAVAVPLLAVTATVACVVPAVRAARLDPVKALRDG